MFQFKQFAVQQSGAAFKVGTDGVLLGAIAHQSLCGSILDIGTGTGVLALMLAQKYPQASITAVEIDPASAQQANENVQNSPFAHQIKVIHKDIDCFAKETVEYFDLIVCNPPFFNFEEGTVSPNEAKGQARHTVRLSHEQLLLTVGRLLAKNGRFFTILPQQQLSNFETLLKKHALFNNQTTFIKPKPSKPVHRVLLKIEQHQNPLENQNLTIETETRHLYTHAYFERTKDFYLDLKHE